MVIDIQVAEIREFGVFQSRWFCQLNNHWLERADFRSERPDGGGGGGWTNKWMDEQTNEKMDKRMSPCVLQALVFFRIAAQKRQLWSFMVILAPFQAIFLGYCWVPKVWARATAHLGFIHLLLSNFIQVQFRALDVVGGHNDGNEWWKWASLGYKRYGPFCGSAIGKSEFCSHPVTPLWYCLIASLRCKIVGAHRELGKLWDHAKKSVMKLYNLINKRKEWKISVTNWEQNLNFAVRGTAKCTLYFQANFFLFLRWLCS